MSSNSISVHAQILTVIFITTLFAVIFEMIRRHRLQERYAFVWVIIGAFLLIGALIPGSLQGLAQLLGISDTSIAILSALLVVILILLLHMTSRMSVADERVTRIQQEVAILSLEIEQVVKHNSAPRTIINDTELKTGVSELKPGSLRETNT